MMIQFLSIMNKHILVVDDDPSILAIFEYTLQEVGYTSLLAHSGETALEFLVEGHHIDLVFLDVKMSGMSGIETFQEIHKKYPNLPIIMMTGYSLDELKDMFSRHIYGIIYKPFDREEVLAVIHNVLQVPA